MKLSGNLDKVPVVNGSPVQYNMTLGADTVNLNTLLGHTITLRFDGLINCIVCGRKTNKPYGQGLCFPCFQTSPENSECIIRPELCQGHIGKGRDPEWELAKHVQPHVVYLALTSCIKVGVTRAVNIPDRWIDQGAWKVIRLAETPYRQLAGEIEVFFKDYITDKTDWRKMLQNTCDYELDLVTEKNRLLDALPEALGQYYSPDDTVMELAYPVLEYPAKVNSVTFDKEKEITGELRGIRGQYIILDGGRVLNLRKHSGYFISLESAALETMGTAAVAGA